tara:strand:+ start:1857 stop:1979 length:123 start_codon:yes stop_codon:yes gene_type:complete
MIKKVKYILLKIIKYLCVFKKEKEETSYSEFAIGLENIDG